MGHFFLSSSHFLHSPSLRHGKERGQDRRPVGGGVQCGPARSLSFLHGQENPAQARVPCCRCRSNSTPRSGGPCRAPPWSTCFCIYGACDADGGERSVERCRAGAADPAIYRLRLRRRLRRRHEQGRGVRVAHGGGQLVRRCGSHFSWPSLLMAPTSFLGIPGWRLAFLLLVAAGAVVGVSIHSFAHWERGEGHAACPVVPGDGHVGPNFPPHEAIAPSPFAAQKIQ